MKALFWFVAIGLSVSGALMMLGVGPAAAKSHCVVPDVGSAKIHGVVPADGNEWRCSYVTLYAYFINRGKNRGGYYVPSTNTIWTYAAKYPKT